MAGSPRSNSDPLKQIVATWVKKLKSAEKYKKPFSDDAKEASLFFDGDTNWMWKDSYARGERGYNASIAPPAFKMQVNAVFDMVEIFGSVIYFRNPVRTVTVQNPPDIPLARLGLETPLGPNGQPSPDQMMIIETVKAEDHLRQERDIAAMLLESYLNWNVVELDLKRQARKVVNEALIKGAGVFWTELVTLDTSGDGQTPPIRMVGSFYDSIDNLLIDPDFDNEDDALWCARKCTRPLEEVAAEYGLQTEELKKHLDGSVAHSLHREPRGKRKDGSNELVTYYKIWSKTGMGDRLKDHPKENKGAFDAAGRYCYLVICEGVDFPLNLPPELMDEPVDEQLGIPQSVLMRAAWPIPFYADPNGWPYTMLAFHRKPNYAWPISHIRPAIGELRLLNWIFSFLASRIATSCETVVAVQKAADETIKEQLLQPSEGGYKILELSELLGRSVNDVVSIMTMPEVNKDLWQIAESVMEQFSKRTGLSELAYGMTKSSLRSAAEAQIKNENISIRPDNMSNELEDCMSLLSRREALAARWLLEPQDVAPVLGPVGATAWMQYISKRDMVSITRELLFRVEAGSARKPNKSSRVEQMQMALQTLGPILSNLAGAGVTEPFNSLMKDWADSLDLDASPYLLPPPQPPPPPAPLDAPPGLPSPQPEQAAPGGGGPGGPPPEEGPPPQVPAELQPQG